MSPPIDRRRLLVGAGMAAIGVAVPRRAVAAIPQHVAARVIVDNDFAGDPDALIALAHQLMVPTTQTMLITGSPVGP